MTPPIVIAELRLTALEAAPLIMLMSPRVRPFPPFNSEIRVRVDKAAFRSIPSIFPSFFPRIPKLDAVVPPEISLIVKDCFITELVSVTVIPFPELFIEAVKLEDTLPIAVITFASVIDDVIVTVPRVPALSVIEKEPAVIPVPPFNSETLVEVFKSGFKSVPKTSEPGIFTLTLISSSI